MNRSKLKSYAPQARRDFIRAVTDRAAQFGLEKDKTEPIVEKGDVAIIGGKPFPRSVAAKRKRLEEQIARRGFDQFMEAMAYTWFNRLMAIRFMELHGYLDHGYRVLSAATDAHGSNTDTRSDNSPCSIRVSSVADVPEILLHAEHVDLPGLDKQKVVELKLDGTKDAELYRMLLVAQCNALHAAMPFLFERIDDETELLLPDNLLHSDSLVRKMVRQIDEEDWQEVEIIGWLYQFYISERKDEVIGKVVRSEDIPAATQLFTPNWIVKYLVQNSLGRQWLATYPNSPLRQKMEYYIEPAEQTPEVQEQLKAITPTSLNPEELTLLDPACGSGHILVEAYDLLKAIYQERGYRAKDIPRLILEKNLFGLEICDRAAQLAAFALMMKARADDRRIFASGVQPHVLAIQESKGLDAREITDALNAPIFKGELPPSESLFEEIDDEKSPLFACKTLGEKGGIPQTDVKHLIDLFEHGKTLGSLIRVPESLAEKLPIMAQRADEAIARGEMFEKAAARKLKPLLEQARMLACKFDAVVANPPYMTSDYMPQSLKRHITAHHDVKRTDLYAVFIERSFLLGRNHSITSMISRDSWMFLPTYERLRDTILANCTLLTMADLGPYAFDTIGGHVVQTTMFATRNTYVAGYAPTFFRLVHGDHEEKQQQLRQRTNLFTMPQRNLTQIPGSPFVFWASESVRKAFSENQAIGDVAELREGIHTGRNDLFLRCWWEIPFTSFSTAETSVESIDAHGKKWIPYNKGGMFRKWFGNNEFVLAFDDSSRNAMSQLTGHVRPSQHLYFREGGTWTDVGSDTFAVRYYPSGFLFDGKGMVVVSKDVYYIIALMNSKPFQYLANLVMPTLNYKCGTVKKLPYVNDAEHENIARRASEAIAIAKEDWDSAEMSWEFSTNRLVASRGSHCRIANSWLQLEESYQGKRAALLAIEQQNNASFIRDFGLMSEMDDSPGEKQATLFFPDREEDIKRLISYAIGCMMGRYSLDKPGLIYAHSGNKGFDPSQYKTFPADPDGIVPLTETDWFPDDAANRVVEFIGVAWPKEHLEENLKFVADSLGPREGEQPRDTIRRYLATGFFKHHLQMYKRRPIYWLFSSGKQRAFQCLVYLHRYHEGTLSRMRTEYVIPLSGKISARIDQLAGDIAKATSTSHRKKLKKEKDKLVKQQAELALFDEKLRHYADQRISLDLDDGVKVNYGKFGDLLAEVRAVTGGSEEE